MEEKPPKSTITKIFEILIAIGAILGTLAMIYYMEEGQTWPSL